MFRWIFGKPKETPPEPASRDILLVLRLAPDGDISARWKIPPSLSRKEALDLLVFFRGLGKGELNSLLFSQLSAAAFNSGQQQTALYLGDTLEDLEDCDEVIAPDKVFSDGEDS